MTRTKDKSRKDKWNKEIRTTLHGKCCQRLKNGVCHCLSCVQGHTSASVFSVTMASFWLMASLSASDMAGDVGLWYEAGEGVTRVWARRPTWSPWGHHVVWPEATPALPSGLDEVPARAGGAQSSCYCPAKVRDGRTTAGCICRAQCILSFSSKLKENIAPNSK